MTGVHEYAITTLLFNFDPAGNFIGTLKARAIIRVNEATNEFTSTRYVFEAIDKDGNILGSGEGVAHGERIRVESVD